MAYLYRHIRLDKNIPFYIGIGDDKNYKRAFSKNRRNKHWRSIVNKTSYEIDILIDDISWDDACLKEKEFIKLYGRSDTKCGTLVNKTDGGEGSIGIIVSQSTKDKISKAFKGRVFSEETKKKLSLKAKGRKYSKEHVKKMSERAMGRKFSEERNKKISETAKKQYASGERKSTFNGKIPWNKGMKQRKATVGQPTLF